ncbi:thiamine-phosphate kinase [Psychroflexus sp. ALD_RP9]|uniref:thiamine-phosphate kinase n=1 Tax=Psychroflexus sp. ALD_RP9 TaxID=2777186 RepID=UPI001A8D89B0|nr:thiamine-phosphate kinase [Psychroflexus sp. ALD_RP9]QSS97980.1 thiamine-phosphate kinase [Psychroflexus sp. ALD_RP9]
MFENTNNSKTKLSELGEFGLIDHLTQHFKIKHKASTLKSIGDDAAVLKHENEIVVTTDLLVEGVHFDLAYMPLKHLGYKAVMVNLSDVYAMNAQAKQITVSIACSNRFTVEALEELYAGISTACEVYNVDVVGGDTTSSVKGLQISITAIGESSKENITYRNGAKPNDLLVVSGDLGGAFLGLKILEREKEVFKVNPNAQPDLSEYTYLVQRQLKPEARKDIVELLAALDVQPTAMIDISDGLSSEIMHLCKNSKVGANLFEDKLPLDPKVISTCEEFKLDSTTVVLNGGEDYELLFTINQNDFDKIKSNPHLSVIGHMCDASDGIHLISRMNTKIPMKARGWSAIEDED